MIELHNKQAIWEVTVTGTTSSGTENIEGTYFKAIQFSASHNKDKTIDLTTATALLKKYTNAFKSNNKNTAKSKALSEKITELKGLNQDEILVQLTTNTYQTLEQFYTGKLFKSIQGTVIEVDQTKLLSQLKSELSTVKSMTEQAMHEKQAEKIVGKNHRKLNIITAFLAGSLLTMLIKDFNTDSNNANTYAINDTSFYSDDNFSKCFKVKDDLPTCFQYASIINEHKSLMSDNKSYPNVNNSLDNKISALITSTETFNEKIYNDIESCNNKNLPDTRGLLEKFVDAPSLLTMCQSREILKIKKNAPIQKESTIIEVKEPPMTLGMMLIAAICALAMFCLVIKIESDEDVEKSKRE